MAIIIEDKFLRSKVRVFGDRQEAGRLLASKLSSYRKQKAIVLAIPSGGVPVGLEIALELSLPFDLIITRKILIPGTTEAGFGAISLEGEVFLNEVLVEQLNLTPEEIQQRTEWTKEGIEERNRNFRAGRSFPDIANMIVILVDDGLASGYTMLASINLIKRKGSKEIIVAVPTAPMGSIRLIEPYVDKIFCLNIREGLYFAVADAYETWYDLSDTEVLQYLEVVPRT